MTYLCAYFTDEGNNESTFDVDSYTSAQLNGNAPYKIVDTLPPGYKDISTIENWWYMYEHQNGILINKDYKYIRNEIMILAATIGWSNLSSTEKDIAARIFAVGETERDELFTIEEQIDLGLLHHIYSKASREMRLAKTQMQLFNRLSKTDWSEVAIDTEALIPHYLNEGIEGTVEGDTEGLFDYVDGDSRSNHTWDGNGSEVGFRNKTYSVTGYNNCSDFADDLLNILKNGEY